MAIIDRHRVARLVELSAAERTLKGPERQLREDDVKLLIKAAYDDATESARADFMARVQKIPTSAWPWSAVQVTFPRSGGGSLGVVVAIPKPVTTPPLLALLRGQADSVDLDSGNRLPDRGTPEAAEWEPLYKALDAWDTQTLTKSIGPQGWVSMLGNTSGQVQTDAGAEGTSTASSEAPASPTPADNVPASQAPAVPSISPWQQQAILAAGVVVVVVGGVAVYSLGQNRSRRELEAILKEQEERT